MNVRVVRERTESPDGTDKRMSYHVEAFELFMPEEWARLRTTFAITGDRVKIRATFPNGARVESTIHTGPLATDGGLEWRQIKPGRAWNEASVESAG